MSTDTPPKDRAAAAAIEPEWIRVSEACDYAHVSRAVVYGWLNAGFVRNISLRQPGQRSGTRLISFSSLRRYLEGLATGGEAEGKEQPPEDSNS